MVFGQMKSKLALLTRNICGAMVSISLAVAVLQALSNPVSRSLN